MVFKNRSCLGAVDFIQGAAVSRLGAVDLLFSKTALAWPPWIFCQATRISHLGAVDFLFFKNRSRLGAVDFFQVAVVPRPGPSFLVLGNPGLPRDRG